jgi:hypothetical protein
LQEENIPEATSKIAEDANAKERKLLTQESEKNLTLRDQTRRSKKRTAKNSNKSSKKNLFINPNPRKPLPTTPKPTSSLPTTPKPTSTLFTPQTNLPKATQPSLILNPSKPLSKPPTTLSHPNPTFDHRQKDLNKKPQPRSASQKNTGEKLFNHYINLYSHKDPKNPLKTLNSAPKIPQKDIPKDPKKSIREKNCSQDLMGVKEEGGSKKKKSLVDQLVEILNRNTTDSEDERDSCGKRLASDERTLRRELEFDGLKNQLKGNIDKIMKTESSEQQTDLSCEDYKKAREVSGMDNSRVSNVSLDSNHLYGGNQVHHESGSGGEQYRSGVSIEYRANAILEQTKQHTTSPVLDD